jgi:hypothetical protein
MTNNFIGVYENVLPHSACDELINFFEKCDKLGLTYSRQQADNVSKLDKDDDSLFLIHTKVLELLNYDIVELIDSVFWSTAYKQYVEQYPILSTIGIHKIFSYKLQRTSVGGGYHIWHAEQDSRLNSDRVLSFTCYLNDVYEGGETEFLYYPKRVAAKKGAFLLFPGAFTHAHRGNPPISNTKYIITGWVQFCG